MSNVALIPQPDWEPCPTGSGTASRLNGYGHRTEKLNDRSPEARTTEYRGPEICRENSYDTEDEAMIPGRGKRRRREL